MQAIHTAIGYSRAKTALEHEYKTFASPNRTKIPRLTLLLCPPGLLYLSSTGNPSRAQTSVNELMYQRLSLPPINPSPIRSPATKSYTPIKSPLATALCLPMPDTSTVKSVHGLVQEPV